MSAEGWVLSSNLSPQPSALSTFDFMAFTTSNGRTQTSLAEINVTPLVDVMLVLLIIFMVTAPVIQSGIEVDVPQTRTVEDLTHQSITVNIDKKGSSYAGN